MRNWIIVGAISVFGIITLALIFTRPDTTDDTQVKPSSFGADMSYHFDCTGKAPSGEAIQKFMQDKGFRTLDAVHPGKPLDQDFSWMHMNIVGIDSTRRQITFKSFADQTDEYAVSLTSEPPTQHSKDLEDALVGFTEKTLGCKNSQLAHLDNPANAKDLYDKSFSMTEGWFREAAGMPAAATAVAPAASTK